MESTQHIQPSLHLSPLFPGPSISFSPLSHFSLQFPSLLLQGGCCSQSGIKGIKKIILLASRQRHGKLNKEIILAWCNIDRR